MSDDHKELEPSGSRVRRARSGFSASGRGFYLWEEDETSAQQWLQELEGGGRRQSRRARRLEECGVRKSAPSRCGSVSGMEDF